MWADVRYVLVERDNAGGEIRAAPYDALETALDATCPKLWTGRVVRIEDEAGDILLTLEAIEELCRAPLGGDN